MELVASSCHFCHSFSLVGASLGMVVLHPWKQFLTTKASAKSVFPLKATLKEFQVTNQRRSAHYHPSIWDPKFIASINTAYTYELHGTRLEELKEEAKRVIESTRDSSTLLKLIDSLQQLGVSYHFEKEIDEAIDRVRPNFAGDLYTVSLQFRLLREHGRPISLDVFDKFKDRSGQFMECLSEDIAGLLSLYEATQLRMAGEDDLEAANNFSVRHLKSLIGKMGTEIPISNQVKQSLEIPIYRRLQRLAARSFIDLHLTPNSSELIDLAKLDYNLVQSAHQEEVKELTKWWRDMGFKEKLKFSRDRLMENFLWSLGILFEPQFSQCRIGLTKFICILTAIDDMYDVYGSLDELEHFTDAVNRWDLTAMDELPEFMKICYLAMFNFGNEIAYCVLRDHGVDVRSYIKEEWANLCKSYLVEARWFYSGYTPTLEEYLENAWISVGGHAALAHAYLLLGSPLSKASLELFKLSSQPIYWASVIARLCDDLGTSQDEILRGDVAKSIQCCMLKEGVSEEEARDHIQDLISFSWKKLNEEIAKNCHPKPIVNMSLNMARAAHCIFQHGDGIGTSIGVTKDRLTSLIVQPIPILDKSIA